SLFCGGSRNLCLSEWLEPDHPSTGNGARLRNTRSGTELRLRDRADPGRDADATPFGHHSGDISPRHPTCCGTFFEPQSSATDRAEYLLWSRRRYWRHRPVISTRYAFWSRDRPDKHHSLR